MRRVWKHEFPEVTSRYPYWVPLRKGVALSEQTNKWSINRAERRGNVWVFYSYGWRFYVHEMWLKDVYGARERWAVADPEKEAESWSES